MTTDATPAPLYHVRCRNMATSAVTTDTTHAYTRQRAQEIADERNDASIGARWSIVPVAAEGAQNNTGGQSAQETGRGASLGIEATRT